MKEYFTINELCKSRVAVERKIDNSIDEKILKNLNELISFLNPLREAWGSPIRVNSGYRCPELNKAVGGSKTSVHMLGYAADLYPCNGKFGKFKDFLVDYLKDKNFDQCLIEKSGNATWIHIGLYNNYHEQRRMIKYINK